MDVRTAYKQTEVGAIPEDWDGIKLGESINLLSGHHVLASHCNARGLGVPYITGPADFPDGVISHSKFTDRPSTICRAGDILVTVKGSGAGSIVMADAAYCISRQLMAIRIADWDKRFVFYSLLHNATRFKAASTGLIPGLSRSDIKDQLLPFPKVREQRAIAEALGDVDALLDGLDRLIAKQRDLKQAAMQQLLTGQTRLPGFSGEWEVKRLDEVADIRSGGTPSTADSRYWNGEIPWCTPTDITALNGKKYLNSTDRTITSDGLAASSAEIIPTPSVVMTSRATIGLCAINAVPVTTNQGFKNFVPFESTDVEFLYYLLGAQTQGFIRLCGGSTFLEIGKGQLAAYRARVPSEKDEQSAIAAVLSDMDAELAALEVRRAKTRDLKQAMMQELLTGKTRLVKPEAAHA